MVFRFTKSSVDGRVNFVLVKSVNLLSPAFTCFACRQSFLSEDNFIAEADASDWKGVEIVGGATSSQSLSLNGYGTMYSISQAPYDKQLYSGSLCDVYGNSTSTSSSSSSYHCKDPISTLPAGEYVWRVTGALDASASDLIWKFCDTQGGVTTELKFRLDGKGHCSPSSVSSTY